MYGVLYTLTDWNHAGGGAGTMTGKPYVTTENVGLQLELVPFYAPINRSD